MQKQPGIALEVRLQHLERRLRLFQIVSVVALVALAIGMYVALQGRFAVGRSAGVLRARGLVIEDREGRQRILLGAPVPKRSGRLRQDETVGLLVLGENGTDRVALGAPTPDPQSGGTVSRRIGAAAGLMVADKNGNERGGFAVLDNDGRAVLGLDYQSGGEAITLAVLPEEGPSLQIKDTTSLVRAALVERNNGPALLYGISFSGKSKLDLDFIRLSPYAIKHVVIKPDEGAFTKALDSMKR
jgi:hypothetical protein